MILRASLVLLSLCSLGGCKSTEAKPDSSAVVAADCSADSDCSFRVDGCFKVCAPSSAALQPATPCAAACQPTLPACTCVSGHCSAPAAKEGGYCG